MLTEEQILNNYVTLKEALVATCQKYGRKPEDVTLVAISKFQPVEALKVVANAGQQDFGENYVQEALAKEDDLKNFPIKWHMTGHVQSRKASQVAGNFDLVHTLDSQKLALAYEKALEKSGKRQKILFEVNIGEEPQKSGISAANLTEIGEYVLGNCPHLELRGLMCLPPVFDSGEAARPYFAKLRNLRDELAVKLGINLPDLSMGMSGDYWAAIAEGATFVRIGTNIFGPRPVPAK